MADFERRLAEACAKDRLAYALAGFSSAARYAPMVRYQRAMAYAVGSLNKLVDERACIALAQFDAEAHFLSRAARGSTQRGLALLDQLDRSARRGAGKASRCPERLEAVFCPSTISARYITFRLYLVIM
jgi:hypothetical protein